MSNGWVKSLNNKVFMLEILLRYLQRERVPLGYPSLSSLDWTVPDLDDLHQMPHLPLAGRAAAWAKWWSWLNLVDLLPKNGLKVTLRQECQSQTRILKNSYTFRIIKVTISTYIRYHVLLYMFYIYLCIWLRNITLKGKKKQVAEINNLFA